MEYKKRKWFIDEFMKAFQSMNKAIDEAGGVGINYERTKEMTVHEFLASICPNGIEFVYKQNIEEKKIRRTK